MAQSSITSPHLKDRTADGGNLPWGHGQTERWLRDEKGAAVPSASEAAGAQWLEEWFRSADEAISHAPADPSATELLMQDRNRLEKP